MAEPSRDAIVEMWDTGWWDLHTDGKCLACPNPLKKGDRTQLHTWLGGKAMYHFACAETMIQENGRETVTFDLT